MSASRIEDGELKIEEAKPMNEDRGSASGAFELPGMASSTGIITDPARDPSGNPRSSILDPRSSADDPRLTRALEEYLRALEQGQPPNRNEFLARHADLAAPLAECLEGLEFVNAVVPQMSPSSGESGASPAADIQPEIPLGDYRIIRQVGRGGMGVVYEAIQLSLGRRVALKVLPFAAALDAKHLQRFKNEAQAAANLHHTNIVPVYAVGCERGVHYYAMQFIEGQTLASLIRELRVEAGLEERRAKSEDRGSKTEGRSRQESPTDSTGPYNPKIEDHEIRGEEIETAAQDQAANDTPRIDSRSSMLDSRSSAFFHIVANLGIQAAEALEYAHQMGVIHRDIKPGNILIESSPFAPDPSPLRLWITDFGLAHCQSQAGLTMTGDLMGTLRYMSPEQALGKRTMVDNRTDIYSLGVTLYELLTLQPPFEGNDRQQLIREIGSDDEPLPLCRLNKQIPAELETVVLKAMEKNPVERYATAQELADDLQRFLEDKPIRAKRPGAFLRLCKWTRRHKLPVGLALAGISMALLCGTYFEIHRHRQWVELETFVRERLSASQVALESKSFAEARLALSEAGSRVDSWPKGRDLLRHELKVVLQELESKIADWEAKAQFQKLVDEARYLSTPGYHHTSAWWGLLPAHDCRLDGLEKCRKALEKYHLLSTSEGAGSPAKLALSPQEIQRTKEDICELLLLQAELKVSLATGPPIKVQRLREAISSLDEAETIYGPTQALYKRRSEYWKQLGSNANSERDAKLAEGTPATTVLDYYLLGHQLHEMAENASSGKNKSSSDLQQKSLDCFVAALRLNPDHYWSVYQAAWRLQALGRYQEACLLASNLIALRPEAESYWVRGQILYGQGKNLEAIADFEKAIQLKPSEGWDNKSLFNAYMAANRLERGVELCTRLIESEPSSAQSYLIRGQLFCKLQKWEETLRDAQKVLSLEPRNGEAYVLLGDYFCREANYVDGEPWRKALESYAKAEEIDPTSHLLHYHRGWGYATRKELGKALADFTKDVENHPDSPYNYWRRGRVHLQLENVKQATADYERYIALSGNSAHSHFVFGCDWTKARRYEEALAHFDKAIELNPNSDEAYVGRGMARVELGALQNALDDFNKAIDLNMGRALTYLWRGSCWNRLGDHSKEAVDVQRFTNLELDPKRLNRIAWDYVSTTSPVSNDSDIKMPVGKAFWENDDYILHPPMTSMSANVLPLVEKAVELSRGNADHLNPLGAVYYRLGNFHKATKRSRDQYAPTNKAERRGTFSSCAWPIIAWALKMKASVTMKRPWGGNKITLRRKSDSPKT